MRVLTLKIILWIYFVVSNIQNYNFFLITLIVYCIGWTKILVDIITMLDTWWYNDYTCYILIIITILATCWYNYNTCSVFKCLLHNPCYLERPWPPSVLSLYCWRSVATFAACVLSTDLAAGIRYTSVICTTFMACIVFFDKHIRWW